MTQEPKHKPSSDEPKPFVGVHDTDSKELEPTKDGRKRFWWLGRVVTERKWKPWL
jgi:hypothetical protein